VFLYRKAAELYLKAVILGPGRNLLSEKPVPESFLGPRSIKVLIDMSCRILEAVGWDDSNSVRKSISELEGYYLSIRTLRPNDLQQKMAVSIPKFAMQLDAILDILDAAAETFGGIADVRE
jgi:hypothetical protein